MSFPIYQFIFFIFAAALLGSAIMVIVSRNPVRAVLFLVLAFFSSAILWMLLEAEFLSLVLIFVYVGAVMTLFLFVVMMINVDLAPLKEGFVRYLPLGVIVVALFVGLMLLILSGKQLGFVSILPTSHGPNYSNVVEVGMALFTNYLYAFEIAGLILLVAMVSAISLAFYGRKPGTKSQKISRQLQASKNTGLRIIKMKAETK